MNTLESTANPIALQARNLTAAYKGDIRLKDVNVSFYKNRITTILGPSGCGKSTLLRTLNRTLELVRGAHVCDGSVHFNGADIYDKSISASWVRTHIGMVQQKPMPFQMSILDNVLFGARYHGLAADPVLHAREFLERVGLWNEVKDRLKSPASSLSGGQQQRMCIARTLAVKPSIVLMDEPCSALDPKATATIEGLVSELASEYTIIMVTHNVAQAKRIAQHCVVMHDGEAIDMGSREDVLINPKNTIVRDFVAGVIG